MNYAGFAWNEVLALHEVLAPLGLGVCGLAVHHGVRSMGVTLQLVENRQHPTWREGRRAGFRQQAALVVTDQPIVTSDVDEQTVSRFLRLSKRRNSRTASRAARNA
jgi:hypothetical protein